MEESVLTCCCFARMNNLNDRVFERKAVVLVTDDHRHLAAGSAEKYYIAVTVFACSHDI